MGDAFSAKGLYDDLVAHKLIIPVGVPGIFGRGPVFEDVLRRFDAVISQIAAKDGATVMAFPPTLDRKVFEKSEFLDSFPQLAGSVFSFSGNERDHAQLRDAVHAGTPWAQWQTMTDVVLTPAACYPVYPSFTGTIPEAGHLVDMQNWVFRHERVSRLLPAARRQRLQLLRQRARPCAATRRRSCRYALGPVADHDGRRPHSRCLLPRLSELHRDHSGGGPPRRHAKLGLSTRASFSTPSRSSQAASSASPATSATMRSYATPFMQVRPGPSGRP